MHDAAVQRLELLTVTRVRKPLRTVLVASPVAPPRLATPRCTARPARQVRRHAERVTAAAARSLASTGLEVAAIAITVLGLFFMTLWS